MKSRLLLYHVNFTQENNFQFDDMTKLLAQFTPTTITNFQYVKHDSRITIKLNKNQYQRLENNYNYVAIQDIYENEGSTTYGKTYYYYVDSIEWGSENAQIYNLKMDVLNSFKSAIHFRKSTKILREHKNRYEWHEQTFSKHFTQDDAVMTSSDAGHKYWEITFTSNVTGGFAVIKSAEITAMSSNIEVASNPERVNQYTFKIEFQTSIATTTFTMDVSFVLKCLVALVDKMNEGFNPILYKTDSSKLVPNSDTIKWYLVYKNHENINPDNYNQVNPVDTFLYPDKEIVVQAPHIVADFDVGYSSLTTFMNFSMLNNGNREFYLMVDGDKKEIKRSGSWYFVMNFQKVDSTTMSWRYDKINRVSGQVINIATGTTTSSVECYWYESTMDYRFYYSITSTIELSDVVSGYVIPTTTYTYPTLNGFDSINLTDSKLIKIIACPYCPIRVIYDDYNDYYIFEDSAIKVDNSTIQINDGYNFKRECNINGVSVNKEFDAYRKAKEYYVDSQILRSSIYDTKLFNSDYYYKKFVYDSFTYPFRLERRNMSLLKPYLMNEAFAFDFKTSNTINSRFLFDFTRSVGNLSSNEDFEKILIANRNNEMTIYSNQYINYLRTGYNYDVKAKTRRNASAIIGAVGGTLAGASQLASAGISGALTITNSLMGAINNIISNEEALDQKRAQLEGQATSVESSDDIDLLEYYADNKAYLMKFECDTEMKNALNNLFYYTGYKSVRIGQPNGQTRRYFDFLQCEADIYLTQASSQWIIDELKEKYSEGVTRMHPYNNVYDLLQINENYETEVFINEN